MPDEDDIVISDQIYFDLEDLVQCQECLKNYKTKMNTPGYGMLSGDNFNFVTNNRNYKRTGSRKSLNGYYYYYNFDPYGGEYIDLAQEGSSEAYGILSNTIKGLVQFNQQVHDRFILDENGDIIYGGEFGPPAKGIVSEDVLFLDNFFDAAFVDSYNGILALVNEARVDSGHIPVPYAYRLSADDTLGPGNEVREQIIATAGYASGSVATERALALIPGCGEALAYIHASSQGAGVGVAHALNDDGMVTNLERRGSIVVGGAMGAFFKMSGDVLEGMLPVTRAINGEVIPALSNSTMVFAENMVYGMFGAEIEEVVSEASVRQPAAPVNQTA